MLVHGPIRLVLSVAPFLQIKNLESTEVTSQLLCCAEVTVYAVHPAALFAGHGATDGVVLPIPG